MNWRKFPYPLIVTAIYVVIGTYTNAWDKAWVLYLTVPIYYSLVAALKKPENKSKKNG
ncbi:MAG: hypothetical protein LBI11_05720 [Streptococcaceae bacterium]|jgi:hypothetical protein|nr:hypothetical protein [Streptococcaceae bacterium]